MVQTVRDSVSVRMEGSAVLPQEPVNVQQGLSDHAAASVSLSQTLIMAEKGLINQYYSRK